MQPALERIVHRALEKDFGRRYLKMEEPLRDLRILFGTGSASTSVPLLVATLRRPSVAIPMIILVIIVIAFFVWQTCSSERAT